MSHITLMPNTFHFQQTESRGFCRKCTAVHRLGSSRAIASCLALMKQLDSLGSIDLFDSGPKASAKLKTEYLFGSARGKMFGVMECMQTDGTFLTLHAFSGQYNGTWNVRGWVPPLFEVDDFFRISAAIERQIKTISRRIDHSPPHSEKWLLLREKRRKLSQQLMRDIHGLYRLTNFHGAAATLFQAHNGQSGIPTGTGDCCAPKLLGHAAKNNLIPLGMAEFYWGRENRSASRQHGSFYSSCSEKCEPILGFMLCGLDHHETP